MIPLLSFLAPARLWRLLLIPLLVGGNARGGLEVVPGRAPGAGFGGHVDFPLTNLALHRSREASVLIMASVAENLAAAEARIKADALVSARSERKQLLPLATRAPLTCL